jgi:hypothetical protein
MDITIRHNKILIKSAINAALFLFDDFVKSLLCLTVIYMPILICHRTIGQISLKLRHSAQFMNVRMKFRDLVGEQDGP